MPTKPPTLRPSHLPAPAERRRLHDAHRGSSSARGYDRDWQRVREAVLREEPLCRFCLAGGRVTPGFAVDHILSIRGRPDLRLTRSNLRTLCESHHNERTAREHTPRNLN